ncbi:MAG: hypothetical protein R2911_07005 [Caldilineaceae bacterium]
MPGHQSVLLRLPQTGGDLIDDCAVPFGANFTRGARDDGSNPDAEATRMMRKLLDLSNGSRSGW